MSIFHEKRSCQEIYFYRYTQVVFYEVEKKYAEYWYIANKRDVSDSYVFPDLGFPKKFLIKYWIFISRQLLDKKANKSEICSDVCLITQKKDFMCLPKKCCLILFENYEI